MRIRKHKIKEVSTNVLEINGELFYIQHNYGSHYTLKALDKLNKKLREHVLEHGCLYERERKCLKNYEILLSYQLEQQTEVQDMTSH